MNEGKVSETNFDTEQSAGSGESLWQIILGEVELTVSPQSFTTFWTPTKLISAQENVLTIEVNNIFAKTQFEQKFSPIIKDILKKHGHSSVQLEFITSSSKHRAKTDDDIMVIETPKTPVKSRLDKFQTRLNPRYRFDNFVVGSCNDLAHAAATAAAKSPGQRYNPIFIYGGVGLGKTHLIQAIGNEVMQKDSSRRVLYATTEEFVNDFVYHLKNKTPDVFTKRYRELDLLIVDDIQFIAGKDKI